MSGPQRSANQTAISVSMSKDMLREIDTRSAALHMTRSSYIAALVRNDLIEGGDMVLKEKASGSAGKVVVAPVGLRVPTKYPPLKRK